MIAVRTKCWPGPEGFFEDDTVTVVFAEFTTNVRGDDVAGRNVAFPAYIAVMECAPTVNVLTVMCAVPPLSKVVRSGIVPS